jgi:hypothetical protein
MTLKLIALALSSLAVWPVLGLRQQDGNTSAGRNLAAPRTEPKDANPHRCPSARRGLVFYSRRASEWAAQRGAKVGAQGSGKSGLARRSHRTGRLPCPLVRRLALQAKARARGARLRFERWFRETYERWRCIHHEEGPWNDPAGPYYGGLQADLAFQRTWAPAFLERWGTADRWPVWAQLLMAERAHRVRGFHPWPNTARNCGLL